jgi:hypothetical protein
MLCEISWKDGQFSTETTTAQRFFKISGGVS